jgi:hypothetical protein
MIKLSMDEAAQQLCHLRELAEGDSPETVEVIDNGQPALAVMSWDFYQTLLHWAHVPSDPQELLHSSAETRQRALSVAVAQAESLYADPELLGFEAFGTDDLFDSPLPK